MSTHRPHIPNWKTVKLGEVTEIIKGGTPSRNVEKYFRGNIAWAIPSDITALDSFLYIDDTETYITEEALSKSGARLLPVGTVLLTSRATIGETAIATVPMATNQGFANFVCSETLFNVFLAYYLRYIKEKLNDLASGSTFKEITKGTLLNIEIPYLPLSEQRAIAEVLSDVDGLLNALEALIAKKRAIKQATMQQLLTGKMRLPGFSEAWERSILADFGVFQSGSGFPLAFQGHQSGDYPFFKVSDLSGEGNQLFMNRANHYISENVRGKLGAIRFKPESIVFAKIGAAIFLERKRLLPQESCLDNNMMAFTLTDDFACPRFFYYIFLRIELGKLVSTTALPALSGQHIGAVSLSLPPLAEQRAIASVLSDMDAEIAALEQRRDKTRAIKQGMMQQLLTGRMRLLKSE